MTKKYLPAVLIIGLAVVWYSLLVPWHAINDGFLFLSSHQLPTKGLVAYLWDIFTSPNHSVQYRPLSFATYFILGGKVWGEQALGWEAMALLMFVLTAWQFYLLAKEVFVREGMALLLMTLFLLHPWQWIMRDWSFTLKYFMSLALFLYLCRLIWTVPEWTKLRHLWKFHFLICLGVLSQEAAIVWPLQLILLNFILRKNLNWRQATLFIWPALYYLARQTFLQVDSYKFMQLDPWFAPRGFLYLMTEVFFPALGLSEKWLTADMVVVVLFLVVCSTLMLALLWKAKDKSGTLLLVLGAISLLPFCALKEHLVADRSFWSIPFFILGLFALLKKSRIAISLLAILLVLPWLRMQLPMRDSYLWNVDELRGFEARAKVVAHEIITQEGKDISQMLGEFNLNDSEDYDWFRFPSFHTGDNPLYTLKPFIMSSAVLASYLTPVGGKIVLLAAPRPQEFFKDTFYKWRLFAIALARELPSDGQLLLIPGMGQSDFIQSWKNQAAVYITHRNYYYTYGWEWYYPLMLYPPVVGHFNQRAFILPQKYNRLLRLKI